MSYFSTKVAEIEQGTGGRHTHPVTRAAATPAQFAVSTGDYMYASTEASATIQLGKLLQAESVFGERPIFHVMGNHKCMGPASSNCPNGTELPNVRAYQMMLVPYSQRPYYALSLQASMGEAKFVVIAANAWDATQAAWLDEQLSRDPVHGGAQA
jgi:hypothetical protein